MVDWKKEVARDLIALGSIPFYFLVMARSLVGKYFLFTYQLIVGLLFLFLISLFFKKFNPYLSRVFVLIVFTILFYNDMFYSIFAILAGVLLLVSLFYLKKPKKEIGLGFVFGLITSLIAYYLAPLIPYV